MDMVGWIISLVSGAVGGNATGMALKDKSLGMIGNTIAGLVGGAAGTYIAQAMNLLSAAGMDTMTVGALAGNIGASVVGGGVLTAVIGFIKKAMNKS